MEPVVCTICAEVLTRNKYPLVRERTLRNHMASHIIADKQGDSRGWEIPLDPCMYCCSSVEIMGCGITIVGNKVMPDCKYQNVPAFKQKLLKPIKQFPSTNKPIKCPICSDVGVKPTNVFIPKYNMLEHYKQVHDIDYEQEPLEELENHVISDEEVKKVSGKFPIRKMEVSGARCGA